jgi:hypothetical protein
MTEDCYAILGVAPTASDAEIERVYRRLARAYHPDLLRDVSSEERSRAEERLKVINRAHHRLGDRERRVAYDRERRQVLARAIPAPAPPARSAAPDGARMSRAGAPHPRAARTTYHVGGGPIAVEWATRPPVVVRPAADVFTVGRLLRYALAIILFAVVLGLLWHPRDLSPPPPVPTPALTSTVR